MKKVNLLTLFVALTSGAYVHASSIDNYLRKVFISDDYEKFDVSILRTALSPSQLNRSNPIDFIRYPEYDALILRLPFNSTVAGEDFSFPKTLIRDWPVGELVDFIGGGVDKKVYSLKDSVLNDIRNNNNRYMHRISLYIDKDEEQPAMEFFLRKSMDRTDDDSNGIVMLIGCLRRYGRSDVIEKLNDLEFFKK